MPFDIAIDYKRRIVNIAIQEIFTSEDMFHYLYKMKDDKQISDYTEFVDFSRMKDIAILQSDIPSINQLFQQLHDEKGYKAAIVLAPKELQYGTARMIGNSLDSIVQFEICRDEETFLAYKQRVMQES